MNQKIKQKFVAIIMFLVLASPALMPSYAGAQITGDQNPSGGNYGLDDFNVDLGKSASPDDVKGFVAQIINIILGFLGIIAVVIILYAGFKWMTAGGNEDSVGEAKKMIIQAILGLVIIFLAWAISSFVIAQLMTATDVPVD